MEPENLQARLTKVYDYLRAKGILHTRAELAQKVNYTASHMSQAFKGAPNRLTNGLMVRIADAFPGILNRDYLTTGIGQVNAVDFDLCRPHITVLGVAAGEPAGDVQQALADDCEYHQLVPELGDYDFTIEVSGDSMLPRVQSGDVLACRWLTDPQEHIYHRNDMYVLDTNQGGTVKLVERRHDHFHLIPINPDYDEFDIPFADVYRVASVEGLIRVFHNYNAQNTSKYQ